MKWWRSPTIRSGIRSTVRYTALMARYVFTVTIVMPASIVALALLASTIAGYSPVESAIEAAYSWRNSSPIGYVTVRRCADQQATPPTCNYPILKEVTVAEAARDTALTLKTVYWFMVAASAITVVPFQLSRRTL